MRSSLLVLCALALAVATPAAAQEQQWPEGSAMNVGGLEVKRRDQAAAALGRLERKLLQVLSTADRSSPPIAPDERLIAALKAQQAAWRRYVPDECEVVGSLTGAGGSWPSTYAVRCEANLMELRLRRTRAAIRCIEKLPAPSRQLEQNRCLHQLAPLAVPLKP